MIYITAVAILRMLSSLLSCTHIA